MLFQVRVVSAKGHTLHDIMYYLLQEYHVGHPEEQQTDKEKCVKAQILSMATTEPNRK